MDAVWESTEEAAAPGCSNCQQDPYGELFCRACGCSLCGSTTPPLLRCKGCRTVLAHEWCLADGGTCHQCTQIVMPAALGMMSSARDDAFDPFSLLFRSDPRLPQAVLQERLLLIAADLVGDVIDPAAVDRGASALKTMERHGVHVDEAAGRLTLPHWEPPRHTDEHDPSVRRQLSAAFDAFTAAKRAPRKRSATKETTQAEPRPAAPEAVVGDQMTAGSSTFALRRQARIDANKLALASLGHAS